MSDPLAGTRAKIQRADKHLAELELALENYRSCEPYEIVRDVDDESGKVLYRFHVRTKLCDQVPAIVGDVLHNLRSALDHLAWALVVDEGGTPSNPRDIGFPIVRNSKKLESRIKEGCVEGASDCAVRLIKRLKPYNGGTQAFWIIHELDRIDKHRLLVTLTSYSKSLFLDFGSLDMTMSGITEGGERVSFTQAVPVAPVESASFKQRCIEDGTVLYVGQRYGKMKPKLFFAIALQEPGVVECEPVLPCLTQLVDFTKRVVNIFARFIWRD